MWPTTQKANKKQPNFYHVCCMYPFKKGDLYTFQQSKFTQNQLKQFNHMIWNTIYIMGLCFEHDLRNVIHHMMGQEHFSNFW